MLDSLRNQTRPYTTGGIIGGGPAAASGSRYGQSVRALARPSQWRPASPSARESLDRSPTRARRDRNELRATTRTLKRGACCARKIHGTFPSTRPGLFPRRKFQRRMELPSSVFRLRFPFPRRRLSFLLVKIHMFLTFSWLR